MKKVLVLLLMTVFLAACGSGGGGEETATTEEPTTLSCGSSHPYMMTAVGSSWTYDDGEVQTITGCSDGVVTFQVVWNEDKDVLSTILGSGTSIGITSDKYYVDNILQETVTYTTPFYIFPSSTEIGFIETRTDTASFSSGGTGTISCTHEVIAQEAVTVPAGTFAGSLKIRRSCDNGDDEFIWFAPNVGVVKFVASAEEYVQQLVSYNPGN